MQLDPLIRLLLPTQRLSRTGMLAGSALVLVYVGTLAVQLIEHAFWLDEAQAWLIARASASPLELRQNLRFEGHPPLWHLALWPLARSSANPEWMKVLTFSIGCAFGAIVALGRAVPPLLRPVLLAGFLPIFGYGVLSRPYLLGLLFAFAYLELLHRAGPRDIGPLIIRLVLLVLLSLTHLLYAVLAGVLLLGEMLDPGTSGQERGKRTALVASAAVAVLVTVFAFLPDRSGALVPRSVEFDRIGVRAALLALVEAGGALPYLGSSERLAALGALVVLVTLIGASIVISPRRSGPMAIGVGALLINRLAGYGGEWWHIGVTSFALIILALLALRPGPRREGSSSTKLLPRLTIASMTLLLLISHASSAWLWFADERSTLPYSSAKEAAGIVLGWCESECPVVVDRASTGATVSAYLGAQPVFRLDDRREGTYAIWDQASGTGEVSWNALREAMEERGSSAVGVLSSLRRPPADFIVVGRTGPAAWHKEEYLVVALAPSR